MKKTFLTLLSTENYLKGVLVLHQSLMDTNTNYPFVVLLSERISENIEKILHSYNIQTLRMDSPLGVDIPDDLNKGYATHWNYTFEKLTIFRLTQFEKIIFLDSDMLILENIDELFRKKHLSAVCAGAKFPGNEDWLGYLNSGLLVVEPNINDFENLINLVPVVTRKLKNCGDQDVIKEYVAGKWTENLWLDDKYNMFQIYLDWYIENLDYTFLKNRSDKNIKIVHFIGTQKPWMAKTDLISYLKFSVKLHLFKVLKKKENKKYYRQAMSIYKKYLLRYNSLK